MNNWINVSLQACLGFLFYWRYLCLTSAAYCLIVMFTNCYLPESPYYVLLKRTTDSAKDVLSKFRGNSYNLTEEMNLLNDFKHHNAIRRYISRLIGVLSAYYST